MVNTVDIRSVELLFLQGKRNLVSVLIRPFPLMSKGENILVFVMVMTNVSICCGDETPSWFPSSPKGDIVGNMMQYVFLDGNLLDEVVLHGNLLDEFPFDKKPIC